MKIGGQVRTAETPAPRFPPEIRKPVGNGGLRVYENLCLENRTVKNLRAGV